VLLLAVAAALLAPPKPHILWKPIPFGARRLVETAAYAQRHYGTRTYVLKPRAIVELELLVGVRDVQRRCP